MFETNTRNTTPQKHPPPHFQINSIISLSGTSSPHSRRTTSPPSGKPKPDHQSNHQHAHPKSQWGCCCHYRALPVIYQPPASSHGQRWSLGLPSESIWAVSIARRPLKSSSAIRVSLMFLSATVIFCKLRSRVMLQVGCKRRKKFGKVNYNPGGLATKNLGLSCYPSDLISPCPQPIPHPNQEGHGQDEFIN